MLMSDSSGSKEYNTDEYPSRLMVLGNANLDDYLDERDVAYLENIIKQEKIDYDNYFMCDANFDKVIDEQDVDYLKR